MRKFIFFYSIFCCLTFECIAQVMFQKMYGGNSGTTAGTCHIQTFDGSYILGGYTHAFGAGGSDFYLLKIDQNGDINWSKTYGGYSIEDVESIQQTTDNGFIIWGGSSSFGPYETLLIKTDQQGNVDWSRSFNGSGYDWGKVVYQTLDGGYILFGYTTMNGYDFLLVKVNTVGDIVWKHAYDLGSGNDRICTLLRTTDGGYLMTGYTETIPGGGGDFDYCIVKTDSIGTFQWSKRYGSSEWEFCNAAIETPDNGFMLCGTIHFIGSTFSKTLLIKTDSQGDTLWTKSYMVPADMEAYAIDSTSDSGYIITGDIHNFLTGTRQIYLMKTDSIGDLLWAKTYGVDSSNYTNSVIQTADGGYSVLGKTIISGSGNERMYFIKTDSIGNSGCFDSILNVIQSPFLLSVNLHNVQTFQPIFQSNIAVVDTSSGAIYYTNCSSVGIADEQHDEQIEIYPNPGTDIINLEFNTTKTQVVIQIFDISGIKVLDESLGFPNYNSVNISKLVTGVYFVKLIIDDKIIYKKFVKVKS